MNCPPGRQSGCPWLWTLAVDGEKLGVLQVEELLRRQSISFALCSSMADRNLKEKVGKAIALKWEKESEALARKWQHHSPLGAEGKNV